jgi:hypothetical protein
MVSQKKKEQCLYRSVSRISGKEQTLAGQLWQNVIGAGGRWGMLEESVNSA